MPELKDWNTVKDVANYLAGGVSTQTIYRLVEKNLIGHTRIGTGRGGIRLRREHVEKYLHEHTHEAAGSTPEFGGAA